MRLLAILALFLSIVGCASSPDMTTTDPLVTAMSQRLAFAQEVAWAKYGANIPVRDPERESQVIDDMVSEAISRGMDGERVRTFFAAQIAASCAEQDALIRKWKRGKPGPNTPARDLHTAIRKDIDTVDQAMLNALDRPGSPTPDLRRQAMETLRSQGFDKDAIDLACAPL